VFEKAGGSPDDGHHRTVMGLVHVLENLSAPSTLAAAQSPARSSPPWSVSAARTSCISRRPRLEGARRAEVEARTLILEGILAIQSGDNPRRFREAHVLRAPADREAARTAAAQPQAREPADEAVARSAGTSCRGRTSAGAAREAHSDERCLLTSADMITLLMAFMVLFSISSVNKSKFESLQTRSGAFDGRRCPAGRRSRRPAARTA